MFGISVLIDEVIGIKETLFSHGSKCKEYWLKESKYCPYKTFIYRNLLKFFGSIRFKFLLVLYHAWQKSFKSYPITKKIIEKCLKLTWGRALPNRRLSWYDKLFFLVFKQRLNFCWFGCYWIYLSLFWSLSLGWWSFWQSLGTFQSKIMNLHCWCHLRLWISF